MDFVPTPSKDTLRILLACWAGVFLVLTWMQWRSKRASGVPLAYAFNLSLLHVPGALCYCMEYYAPRSPILVLNGASLTNTFVGFYVALIGFASLAVGVLASSIILPVAERDALPPKRLYPAISSKFPGTILIYALVSFLILGRTVGRIPSLGSLTGSGTAMSIVAVFLFCYMAYRKGDRTGFWKWVVATSGFPFVTVVLMGFANSGTQAAMTVWMFVYRFFKPRMLALLGFVCLLYGSMTFYVNYMRERDSIRAAVWGKGGIGLRLEKMRDMVVNFEVFNPYNQGHLEKMDARLNQNDLVGKAVIYLASGRVGFGEGGTLYAAAVAWVPRILWPNKPSTGGSGSVVARFTGQVFADTTSVGVGQVLELYINWGLTSLVLGFIIYGFLMRYLDERAAVGLEHGDYWRFCRWVLPSFGMLQAGGSFSEVIGTTAANTVFVTIAHYFIFAKFYEDTGSPVRRNVNRPALVPEYRGSK